jgi:hypothetical protein
MRGASLDRRRLAVLGGLFVAAVAYAVVIVRPIKTVSLGRDAAAPVIHFERIMAGRHLETYLGITPKPLITAINGFLYAATGDWRPVAWAEIAAFALAVVVGAVVADRVAGPASAAFVAVALLLSPTLIQEIAFVHAVPWALLAWLIAGLAVTRDRPSYGLAGIALMLGALARLETLLVVVLAAGVLVLAEIAHRTRGRPRPERSAWLVLAGFLALPVMLAHDWLLTGDPLFWARVAQINSDVAGTAQSPVWVTVWLIRHLVEMAPLLPLAALGVVVIVQRRAWPIALGLLALGPGVGAFLVFLAARGTVFSMRYAAPIDLSLLFVAGVGLAALEAPLVRVRLGRFNPRGRGVTIAAIAVGSVTGLAFAPIGVLDRNVRDIVAQEAQLLRNEQRAIAAIRPVLGPTLSWRDAEPPDAAAPPRVLVPARVREQAVVDLDLSLTAVIRTTAKTIDVSQGRLLPGQIVYLDRLDDPADPRYAALEVDTATTVGAVRLVPLLADRAQGIWVILVEASP